MNLDKKWDWERRKLACKVRIETGNPGADELRQRICDLVGVDYSTFQRNYLVNREKALERTVAKEEKKDKDKDKDREITARPSTVQAALRRINTSLQLFSQSDAVRPVPAFNPSDANRPMTVSFDEAGTSMPAHRKNIYKKFIEIIRSPPRRALYDLKMERLEMAIKSVETRPGSEATGYNMLEDGEEGEAKGAGNKSSKKREASSNNKVVKPKRLPQVKLNETMTEMVVTKSDPKSLFKPYNGDIFGTESVNNDGMIYLSRMAPQKRKQKATGMDPVVNDVVELTEGAVENAVEATMEEKSTGVVASQKEIQGKIHCAMTLCNWTNFEANTERLAKEGAVQAIMRLSKESDKTIRRYCAAAFRHMSTRLMLARQLVMQGGVPAISELMSTSNSNGKLKQITIDCTIALVNLTRNVGTEGKLVEDGIVLALMALPNDTEEWDELCARGLFNLTCVDAPYPFMERVVKAFMSLASSSFTSIKYICASALCNISDLRQMRMRMVEEGVIQVLGMLSRGADMKTRRLCAIIVHSLAANKAVRAEMASRGAIQVIYGLSADNDMTTLYCAASAILRLSTEEANSSRLISEGGISAISNVAIRCADVPSTSQACAGVLQILSNRPDQRSVIVQEGCIPALITMLRTSVDYLTLHHSVLAICNLLTLEDNQVHILQQGGVQTIVQLCRHEHQGIQKSCAFAIFTLSCVEAARKQAAACGAIPVIISLAKVPDEQMQMFCAATLCMMSTDTDNIAVMVAEGVIQTFIDLLGSTNNSTIRYSCAALCGLAYNNSSCMKVLEEGAVPHVVAGALKGDVSTRQSCCAVISALSTHAECRQQICNATMNVLPALVSLSALEDEMTRLRCAVAFANLSCEKNAQGMMVTHGVVPILSELSISYSEENQMYCAKALCNLACHDGSETAIVEQGGMAALMMIGMVRTVNQQTKQICAKAVLNLLTEDTIGRMVDEGLVTASSSLCKMEDEATMKACASIFCDLSLHEGPRTRLTAKISALHGLFRLMRSTDADTKSIVGKAVCNLLSYSDSRNVTVSEGGVGVLREIATLGHAGAEQYCAEAFFRICGIQPCRQQLIETQTVPVIILLARSNNKVTRRICVNLLCCLTWHLDSRAEFLRSNGVRALVSVIKDIQQESELEDKTDLVEMCTRAFFYLSLDPANHEAMVQDKVIPALVKAHHAKYMSRLGYKFVTLTMRMLTNTETNRQKMVEEGALELIRCGATELADKDEVMLASVVSLYNLATQRELRTALTSREVMEVLEVMAKKTGCRAVLSALLYILSLETVNRPAMVNSQVPEVLYSFLDKPEAGEEGVITQNCCATVLMLSKSPECRLRMQQASLVPILIKLSKSKNPKICDSASQALNCLSENSNDGIEEGTVAALIAIALDGNAASKTEIRAEDYLQVPEIPAVEADRYVPDHDLVRLPPFQGLQASHQKMPAGPAGKGPKPPKPPSIMDDKKAFGIPNSSGKPEEELCLESEEEPSGVDKIMMFAKMELPPKFMVMDESRFHDEDAGPEEVKLATEIEEAQAAPDVVPEGGSPMTISPVPGSSKNPKTSPTARGAARQKTNRKIVQSNTNTNKASAGGKKKPPQGSTNNDSRATSTQFNNTNGGRRSTGKAMPDTTSNERTAQTTKSPSKPPRSEDLFETSAGFIKHVRTPLDELTQVTDKKGAASSSSSSLSASANNAPVLSQLSSGSMTSGGPSQKSLSDKAAELGLWSNT